MGPAPGELVNSAPRAEGKGGHDKEIKEDGQGEGLAQLGSKMFPETPGAI